MPDLTEAAERVLRAHANPEDRVYDSVQQLLDERSYLAKAYADELDTTPVDEEWLRENCELCSELGTHFYFDRDMRVRVVRMMNDWCLKWGTEIISRTTPTRGLVRTLMRIGGGM